MPGRYTLGHHESVLRSHRWRTAANSAAYLVPHLRPGMNLLDIGFALTPPVGLAITVRGQRFDLVAILPRRWPVHVPDLYRGRNR